MYNYIKCPSCNSSIGEKYELFILMREALHKNAINDKVDLVMISSNNDINIDLKKIYEALNVNNNCCRMRLNTICEFKDLLNENN